MNWSHTKMIYNFHLPLAASHVASGQEHRCGVLEDVDSGRFDTGGGGTGCTSSGGALGWVKRCFFQQKKPVKSGYPPWKLTYPLKIDGWLWWSFLLKWSLCRGTNRAVSGGGLINEQPTKQRTGWLVTNSWLTGSASFSTARVLVDKQVLWPPWHKQLNRRPLPDGRCDF